MILVGLAVGVILRHGSVSLVSRLRPKDMKIKRAMTSAPCLLLLPLLLDFGGRNPEMCKQYMESSTGYNSRMAVRMFDLLVSPIAIYYHIL